MNRKFYYQQRKKQVSYYNDNLKGKVMNQGTFRGKPREFVLQNGLDNLYKGIQGECLDYFDEEHISWWGENKEKHLPSGHLVSSQIHCLNHLFALRKDDAAVKAIIENATGLQIEKVLPSPIDEDGGYITFEFICKNKMLLSEDHETRGANCTSIDASVFVETKDNEQLSVPIEWKYTETYETKDKTCQKRLDRYEELIKKSDRLKMPENGQIPHSIYFQEPSYELMRQTLLCEQLVRKDYAKDFFHINVIPTEHKELRNAVETDFMPMLTKESKFTIIDPQDLLSPLKGNDDYKELMEYLETRYWK